jgi:hypothetical protein
MLLNDSFVSVLITHANTPLGVEIARTFRQKYQTVLALVSNLDDKYSKILFQLGIKLIKINLTKGTGNF